MLNSARVNIIVPIYWFYLPILLKYSFAGYRILGWQVIGSPEHLESNIPLSFFWFPLVLLKRQLSV